MKKLKTYTDEDIRKITARQELADGWYRWMVTKWEPSEPEKGPVGLKLTMAPLEDPEDAASAFKITQPQTLVLQETEESGEIDGFRKEQSGEYGAVLLDGIESKAIWDKKERRWLCDDEELNSEEAKTHNNERTKAGLNGLIEAYNKASEGDKTALDGLVNRAFYAELKRKASNNPQYAGRVFANIGTPYEELPSGAKLVAKGSFIYGKEESARPSAKPAKTSGRRR